jgi:hypothetical protein
MHTLAMRIDNIRAESRAGSKRLGPTVAIERIFNVKKVLSLFAAQRFSGLHMT